MDHLLSLFNAQSWPWWEETDDGNIVKVFSRQDFIYRAFHIHNLSYNQLGVNELDAICKTENIDGQTRMELLTRLLQAGPAMDMDSSNYTCSFQVAFPPEDANLEVPSDRGTAPCQCKSCLQCTRLYSIAMSALNTRSLVYFLQNICRQRCLCLRTCRYRNLLCKANNCVKHLSKACRPKVQTR